MDMQWFAVLCPFTCSNHYAMILLATVMLHLAFSNVAKGYSHVANASSIIANSWFH